MCPLQLAFALRDVNLLLGALGFRVQGPGCRVQILGFTVRRFRIRCLWFEFRVRVQGLGLKVQGAGFGV